GYAFDRSKLGPVRSKARIRATAGQLAYEWKHLRRKLVERCPERARRTGELVAHPLFRIVPGALEAWERRR
ncbi:MAG: pyrimidine dimer DNA glycosylase/endonuclease V, partial [Planctomycetota bacterium]